MGRSGTAAFLLTLALVGCLGSGDGGERRGAAPDRIKSGDVTVARTKVPLSIPYVVGKRAYGVRSNERPEQLRAEVNTTLLGTLAPAAILDATGRYLLYNAWRRTSPALRLRDIHADDDRIVERGAYSAAWREDGALAYVKGVRPDVASIKRYLGHVVVRDSLEAAPVRWTAKPARYVAAAWAGERLIVYRRGAKGFPDLVVLDRRGESRTLARSAALVALSPDGSKAFVARYGSSPPLVRVMDLATGGETASLQVREEAVTSVGESGSWTGDLVVASATGGLIVFRVRNGSVAVDQVLRFSPERFPVGVLGPRADESGRRVAASAQLMPAPRQAIPPAAVLVCDRIALSCVQGPRAPSIPGPRIVYNPSRP
jgi:hypothetical protein